MKLTKQTKQDGSSYWACETQISERHVPKAAGLKWSGRFWWTDEIKKAAKLKEFAEESCRAELDTVKVNSRSAAKVEAMKAEVEAEKNRRLHEASDRETRRLAEAAIRQKEREQRAKEKQDYLDSIHKSPYLIQGNTYEIKEQLREMGCKWDSDRRGWVALNEDTFKAGSALLGVHEKENPTICRWYFEGSYMGEGGNSFHEGELLRHDGGIWAVKKAWSQRWEGEDWNRHATLRPATADEKARFIAQEAETRKELVRTTATQFQEKALETIFHTIGKADNYFQTAMLKHDNGYEYQEHIILEGEQINIGKGQNIYGGGKWFVLAEDKIWAVANNGGDGDCWANNNIRTGGAGAIGYCVPRTDELVAEIRHAAEIANFMGKAEAHVAAQEAREAGKVAENTADHVEEPSDDRKAVLALLAQSDEKDNQAPQQEMDRERD
ncbi:MAG: hypothetical protein IAE94_09665 [Chthoniobacterales bacterium]|nr:hypothetical protein [Chthoniobacterales bacterium]